MKNISLLKGAGFAGEKKTCRYLARASDRKRRRNGMERIVSSSLLREGGFAD